MKKIVLAVSMIIMPFLSAHSDPTDLRLDLVCKAKTIRLGEKEHLILNIVGKDINKIFDGTEGVPFDIMRSVAFSTGFSFEPQREGEFTFGPYSISVMGQQLTSEQVKINVLPKWDGRFGTYFRVDRESILLGEEFELVMETWIEEYKPINVSIDYQDTFSSESGSSKSSTVSNVTGRVSLIKRAWLITPKSPGEFKVSAEIFRELPEGIDPPQFTIQVMEPVENEGENNRSRTTR